MKLFVPLVLCVPVFGQNSYDWTISDGTAEWGSSTFGTSGGSYTRDGSIVAGYTGLQSGVYSSPIGGPYDGASGFMRIGNTYGSVTRTDPNAVFDLSAVGSSATIRAAYLQRPVNTQTGPLRGHAAQFGLTANDTYFGGAGDDSLFVAMDMVSTNSTTLTYDLNFYDETSDNNPTDGNWNWSPLVNLTGAADGLQVKEAQGVLDGVMHAFELVYTNLGGNQLRVDIGVSELDISGSGPSDTVLATNTVYQESVNVNLAVSSLDLTALRPGFGFNFNDATVTAASLGSGVNFDWEDPYPKGFTVPEPSASVLTLLSAMIFLRRRSR